MNKQALESLPSARDLSETTHEMKLPLVSPSDVPTISADIVDHEVSQGFRSSKAWPPGGTTHHELLIHFHLCELIHGWNLNPYRRDSSTATVDEYAEHLGITRFAFMSKEAREDFLDYYGLTDFVVSRVDADPNQNNNQPESNNQPYWFITLTNKFHPASVRDFLDVYKSAMNTLAVIHDERERAIRNDGNKLGFITADHFTAREAAELTRIRAAREKLSAPTENGIAI